jgi:putative peptidoglycan lipid II flippase
MFNLADKNKTPFLSIIAITVFAKAAIYLTELLIAIKFGASRITDSFVIARAIPSRIENIVTWALYSAFLPFYLKLLSKDKEEADILFSYFFKMILVVSGLLCLLISIKGELILKILTPGFDYLACAMSLKLLRIMVWIILFGSLCALLQSVNSSRGNSLVASSSQPINNIVVLFSILFLVRFWGIYSVAVGVALGGISKMLIQFITFNPLRGFSSTKKSASLRSYAEGIWKSFFMIVAVLLIHESIMMVMRIFASHSEGDISILNYGYVIIQAPLLIIETLTFYVFFPVLIERSNLEDGNDFKLVTIRLIRLMFFVLVPAAILMFVSSSLISRVLFLHGKFDWFTADKTGAAIAFFSVGLLGLGIESVAFRVAIILKKMKQYLVILAARFLLNLLLNFILTRSLEPVIALSLAFSLAHIFNAVALIFYIEKSIKYNFGLGFLNYVEKIIVCSSISGIAVFGIIRLCEAMTFLSGFLPRLGVLVLACGLGIVVYLASARRMKLEEIKSLKSMCRGAGIRPYIAEV